MTEKMKRILDKLYQYNVRNLATINFGLDDTMAYDALVVAPSYSPYKLLKDGGFKITETGSQSYCQGFLVEKERLKLAWIKTAAGA